MEDEKGRKEEEKRGWRKEGGTQGMACEVYVRQGNGYKGERHTRRTQRNSPCNSSLGRVVHVVVSVALKV